MKFFVKKFSSWWFDTLVPVHGSLNTIEERETVRKRRLLSTILSMTFFILLPLLLAGILTGAGGMQQHIFDGSICIVMLFTFWVNRRGHLKRASLLYLLAMFFEVATIVMNVSQSIPGSIQSLWCLFLILPTAAGLFLPAWGPLLLTILADSFIYGFLLTQNQFATQFSNPAAAIGFCVFIFVVTFSVTIISVIWTVTSRRAIIQADRASELEQAHQQIAQAYNDLETAHKDLEQAHATIQRQALTDGLTGLPNHRAVMDLLIKELERAQRYERSFSVLFFDADRFKRINDTYGHAVGDAVLRQIGGRVAQILRGGDTIGRFGGEEFVVVLPEADAKEAALIAERVRTAVAAEPMVTQEVEGGLPVTVSIGLATYPSDATVVQDLLSQADEAMYLAKRMGRNQIRTPEEVRRISADVELMTLLQKEGLREAAQREGLTPEHLRNSYIQRTITSLMSLLERRDEREGKHARAVSELSTAIARAMGLADDKVTSIGRAALLHDIGKITVSDALLTKDAPLSPVEQGLFLEHAVLGEQILDACLFLHDLKPAVRYHHERWDGTGYPDHLGGTDIPLAARIIAVADAYDVIQRPHSSQRPYTSEEALKELQQCAGSQFDPAVVNVLSTLLAEQTKREVALLPG